jgi:hypothetical protein
VQGQIRKSRRMRILRLCTLPTERQRGYVLILRGLQAPCQWSEATMRQGVELRRVPAQRFSRPQGLLDAAGKQGNANGRRRPAAEPGCADDALRSTTAVLQRATAAPRRASASRRRPPLGASVGVGRQGCSPASAVATRRSTDREEGMFKIASRGCAAGN